MTISRVPGTRPGVPDKGKADEAVDGFRDSIRNLARGRGTVSGNVVAD